MQAVNIWMNNSKQNRGTVIKSIKVGDSMNLNVHEVTRMKKGA